MSSKTFNLSLMVSACAASNLPCSTLSGCNLKIAACRTDISWPQHVILEDTSEFVQILDANFIAAANVSLSVDTLIGSGTFVEHRLDDC